MTRFHKLLSGTFFLTAAVWGQSQTYTYIGDIVNARCQQAAPIVNRNSRGYVPSGASSFNVSSAPRINTQRMRKPILQHCSLNPGITEFALLDAQGNFLKLDDPGNFKILSQVASTVKKVKVKITGNVEREVLKVVDLQTDDE